MHDGREFIHLDRQSALSKFSCQGQTIGAFGQDNNYWKMYDFSCTIIRISEKKTINEKAEELETMEKETLSAVLTEWDYTQVLRKIALVLIPISVIFPLVVIGAVLVKNGGF